MGVSHDKLLAHAVAFERAADSNRKRVDELSAGGHKMIGLQLAPTIAIQEQSAAMCECVAAIVSALEAQTEVLRILAGLRSTTKASGSR